jgi:hypothetical protein
MENLAMRWIIDPENPNGPNVPVLDSYGRSDPDFGVVAGEADALLLVLAQLRDGSLVLDGSRDPGTCHSIRHGLFHLTRLEDHVSGAIKALIRAHHAAGGTLGELAADMHTSRATAQSTSVRLRANDPGELERWATGEVDGPQEHPATELRPGWVWCDDNAVERQVQEVRVYSDGYVEIETDSKDGSFAFDPGWKVTALAHHADIETTTGVMSPGPGKDPVTFEMHRRARPYATRTA